MRAMYHERMLVDVSHMRRDALDETFALLDAARPASGAVPADPVIASHAGYRFGGQEYIPRRRRRSRRSPSATA